MMLKRAGRTALVLLVLSACAVAPEVDRSFLTGSETHKGVVVFSTTHTGEYRYKLSGTLSFSCVSGLKGQVDDFHTLVQYIDGERPSIPVGNPVLHPEHPMGRIHMLELPAGNCVFDSYRAKAYGMNTTTTLSARPFLVRFTVPDGGVAYIGNYNMEWLPDGGRRSFNDYYERDLAALKALKASPPGPVEKRVGTLSGP